MTLSFPPFTRAVKTIIIINGAIYFAMLLLQIAGQQNAVNGIDATFALWPKAVVHGFVYQLLSYGFLHAGFFHVFFNMLMLWMFGAMLESYWGSRQFWEFYLFGIFGAGLTTVVLAYTPVGGWIHLLQNVPTVGASGGIYAVLMAAAMLFGDQEVYLFPFPFAMKLKYLVGILGIIAVASALGAPSGTANIAHLGGLLFGFIYIKFVPRRGLSFAFSEGYFGIRNGYHRWKRRRAARKFQVYMRKHEQDPKQYFDEYGNFRPPDEQDKKDRGPGGWVN
ncbi:MAG TPA: rhomboid family intramembrane serine protease [Candidatus Angelobacter sp.]|nr:rhomboid family intramembrane serine protease [Candidatus Angelobacter sp.]